MATRRTPLIDNPNAANSPLRSLNLNFMKQKRSLASIQREDGLGQQPPLKKQILEANSNPSAALPRSNRLPRAASAHSLNRRERVIQDAAAANRYSEKEKETILIWQRQNRARFPGMVFFFESVQTDIKEKLVRDILKLGAREAKFFSNDVTHVVTNRPVPAYQPTTVDNPSSNAAEQPQTINPTFLDRHQDVHRRLFADLPSKPKASRPTDVLIRAQEMGKKVYTVEKLHRILVNLLEVDVYASTRVTPRGPAGGANIDQMIESERIARAYGMEKGSNEMHYLRGPYIYVYDMQERYKPIMAREYASVADKRDGDWPQFRSVANGRCPFVEDADAQASREARAQKAKEKEREVRAAKAAMAISAPKLRPSRNPSPHRVSSKRSRDEAADNLGAQELQSRVSSISWQTSFDTLTTAGKLFENPFTGKAPAGKLMAGEPVASGIQKNAATSAIRSQMISSTSGTLGAKAGTSREMLGLQRKVLRMAAPTTSHQDVSSRRATENSHEGTSSRLASRSVAELAAEETSFKERKSSLQKVQLPEKEKRELKPGFCENCQSKFRDFDEHVLSEKHRSFAEDARNWSELDFLLGKLERPEKFDPQDPSEPSSVF